MYVPCILPKYETPIKTSTDKILNIVSFGAYYHMKNIQMIDKYNKDMDVFYECVRSVKIPKIKMSGL